MDIFINGSTKKHSNGFTREKHVCHEQYEEKENEAFDLLRKWHEIPYPDECKPPIGIDSSAGSWPTLFFRRNKNGVLTTLEGDPVCFEIQNPDDINFYKSLFIVKRVLRNLTPKQRQIAEFGGKVLRQSSGPR